MKANNNIIENEACANFFFPPPPTSIFLTQWRHLDNAHPAPLVVISRLGMD